MRNLIYIVAINMEVKSHVEKAWNHHCNKHGCDFRVITTQKNSNMAPHWERYRVFEYFPDYDNYIYVDADALVHWNAPDLFQFSNGNLRAVKDLGSLEWTYNSIQGYKSLFPKIDVDWWNYFTTGYLQFTQNHRELFNSFIHFYEDNLNLINELQYKTLRKGFDQTPFNYFVRQEGVGFDIVPEVYSLGHMPKKDVYSNGMFLNIPVYIWQFNGIPKNILPKVMDEVWRVIHNKYTEQ